MKKRTPIKPAPHIVKTRASGPNPGPPSHPMTHIRVPKPKTRG